MHIVINTKKEKLLIRSDELNYELCRIRQRKDETTGEMLEEWTAFKYFASLPQAMYRVADMMVRSSDATTLKQLAVDIDAAIAMVMSAWGAEAKIANLSKRFQ